MAYWRKHPPIHLLTAARYGYKPPDAFELAARQAQAERGLTKVSEAEFNNLLAQHGLTH